jgi:pyruvate formate lyase activating enzyme
VKERGIVFNLQRYSLHDGPGIRTTVFLKGCPARCWWCHNPESQLASPELACSEKGCLSCAACRAACSAGRSGTASCLACGACADACPTGTLQLVGREMSVEEVMTGVQRDRFFFEDSGGGVTFSGGEPLGQPEFLKALLVQCKAREIHTAVDTAGLCPPETLLGLAPLVDLFLYDLKCIDSGRHLQGTGIANGQILENLRRLATVHDNIWIRIPVVPGFNDTQEEMAALADVVSRTPGVRQAWLLPYHATWTGKPGRYGKSPAAAAEQALSPTQEVLQGFARIFRGSGINISIGGVE